MPDAESHRARVVVDGKFFRLGRDKFFARGVTYGPFAPNAVGEHFCSPTQTAHDFDQMRAWGVNLLRLYDVPPDWFLELAALRGLWLLVDVPWNKQACLDDAPVREAARRAVREAAQACAGHRAVFGISVVNELPPDIVRWTGPAAVGSFLEELVGVVKSVDTQCLCTFGSFPPTEYLRVQAIDFVCFNVYLHHPQAFRNYLARLQVLADSKPLVLGEFGLDSLREGESRQAELLESSIESVFQAGAAGAVVFSFTDAWFKDGLAIEDWRFGLTSAARVPKPAALAVQRAYRGAPHFQTVSRPMVSVVVASYNGARTLSACLESLGALSYPACEVILVDDGSTDETPEIAGRFPWVRSLRHPRNLGLSVARNTGIEAARGEIVAFTDADCRVDEDWLHYLVSDLVRTRLAGMGGPNLLPSEDSWVAAAVQVSPGGPAHVLLTDQVAEHIPGCNMAFWKWALEEIGCFDPVFRKAGDDVDICWRLQQRGYEIGFSPAAVVWHYRRSTVRAYLRQQHGYGEAEALLERKHPEYFNPLGGSMWRGRIYASHETGVRARRPMVYHGLFGAGLFQGLYAAPSSVLPIVLISFEYHLGMTLPLLVLAPLVPWLWPLAALSLIGSVGVCVAAAFQAALPEGKRRVWSKPLVALLFALQPIVRGWARYQGRLLSRQTRLEAYESLESLKREQRREMPDLLVYRTPSGFDRRAFLSRVVARLTEQGWAHRVDSGWSWFDLELYGGRWCKMRLVTVTDLGSDGQCRMRIRLRPALTLPARAGMGSLLGGVLLAIGVLGRGQPLWWALLLGLPAYVWWLSCQQNRLQRLVGVFLDTLAEDLDLMRLPADSNAGAGPCRSGDDG